MEWFWNAVLAWFGWTVVAPILLVFGVIGLFLFVYLIAAAHDAIVRMFKRGG